MAAPVPVRTILFANVASLLKRGHLTVASCDLSTKDKGHRTTEFDAMADFQC